MAATSAAGDPRPGRLPRSSDERGALEVGSDRSEEQEEEEEVESDDDDQGSDAASLADAGSDEDPTFDPDADGDLEVEAVLRARMSRLSISASARKGRKGSAVPKMGEEEVDLLSMVEKLMRDGQLEKLKVYECKAYLRMHKLRLTGKKEVLLNRIREHIEVKNDGELKYPVSSFILNCKGERSYFRPINTSCKMDQKNVNGFVYLAMNGVSGDACKGDVVMFEQNIYRRKKGAPREVKGHLCGQRTNVGRIIKESYGTEKQQHTFTIEILWSKGYKPWPPLHPLLIKGRDLYKDKTMRQPWPDEEERSRVIQEKHDRGALARKTRRAAIQEKQKERMVGLKRMKENKIKEEQNMNQKVSQDPQQKVESTNTFPERIDERKGPSLQKGESENMGQRHISSKANPVHHNEALHKGATITSNQEFVDRHVNSIQHGGLQQKIFSKPTHTQQMVKDSYEHTGYQNRNEILLQEGAMLTSRKEFTDQQALSCNNGGSGNTMHHQRPSKPTPSVFQYPQPPPKCQEHNEKLPQDGVKRTYREQFGHQNNAYHDKERINSSSQPLQKFTHHESACQRGSNSNQNARADHQVRQALTPRNQDRSERTGAGDQKGGLNGRLKFDSKIEEQMARFEHRTSNSRNVPTLHDTDKSLVLGTRSERRNTHAEAKLTHEQIGEKRTQNEKTGKTLKERG